MPDTVGLSTQSLGSQPEYYHVYWGGGRWIEMHGYRSAWPHYVRVASAQRFVCAERSGVIFFSFLLLSFFFFLLFRKMLYFNVRQQNRRVNSSTNPPHPPTQKKNPCNSQVIKSR